MNAFDRTSPSTSTGLDSPRASGAKSVLLLALMCLAGTVGAQTLDQQQLTYNGGTSARTLPGYTVWQSFTPGISGTLTGIDMGFFNNMSGRAQLQIYAGLGTGGTLLQTLTVQVQGVTQPAVTWNTWAVNVPVVAGSVYTFNLIPDATTLPDPYGVCIGSGNPYAGGVMGLNDPSGSYTTGFDVVFRTYVTTSQTPPTYGLVVPNAYRDTPAEMQVAGGAGGHYQQIFSSTEFWPAAETHTISAIAWRPGNALFPGTYTWTISQFEVYVCTTDKAVDGLSTIYAHNYAAATDRTLVYSGPITFTATVTATGGLNAFDVVIPFQVPFEYTPANGNLLIDVTGYDFFENLWQAQEDLVGSSSVTAYLWGDHRYSDGTLNGFGGAGLVTQFTTDYAPTTQVALSAVALQPSTVIGGGNVVGTVTLAAPAPAGGQSVALSSDHSAATVASSVVVAEGAVSVNFTVATTAVDGPSLAHIMASSGGVTLEAPLVIDPAPVTPGSVVITPSAVTGGATATGSVNLSGPAPAGGLVVMLASGNSAATVPASVTVLAGASSANFAITTTAVSATTTTTITASASGGAAAAVLTINPAPPSGPSLYNLDIASSMRSGSKTIGKIEITPAAPAGGATVLLTSSNPSVVSVPASVLVPPGKKQVSFTVTSAKVAKATTVTVTAKLGASQKSTTVTVNP